MFNMRNFFFVIVLHLIIATPHINLYFTDMINESDHFILY